MKKTAFILLCLVLVPTIAASQSLRNLHHKTFAALPDTLQLDTMSVSPSDIVFRDAAGKVITDLQYKFDFATSTIIFTQKPLYTNVTVEYRSFRVNFAKPVTLFDKNDFFVNDKVQHPDYQYFIDGTDYPDLYQGTQLSRKGSISKGVSFGNNQDVIVNSGLNLQLDGKLNDELSILAAITDNNIPIQPAGNSQQLQEFDKVFIKLYNDRVVLNVGDFEQTKPTGYFMSYTKKSQGASVGLKSDFRSKGGKKIGLHNVVGVAVSKGVHHRMEFAGIEGNQGPYRLTGKHNERYIVVLAGSERVYIDGILQQRGADNDYVIDYNMGELTFTVNRPINKDKRIIVEFEYTERSYSRFLITAANTVALQKSKFWINVYSEGDNKNRPYDQELRDSDKELLSRIGDNLGAAIVPGFDSVGFVAEAVRYRLVDTVVDGLPYDSIFVYSIDPNEAVYSVSFAFAGENKGNYVRDISSVNGSVYKWVAPVGGSMRGSYVPYRKIVTPQKKQMITVGGEVDIAKNTTASVEAAYSKNDLNTFSKSGAADDVGYAVKASVGHAFIKNQKNNLSADVNYEFAQRNFTPIENYRPAEFARDWNLGSYTSPDNENAITGHLAYVNARVGSVNFYSSWLQRQQLYNGFRNNLATDLKFRSWTIAGDGSVLNSSDTLQKALFVRHKMKIAKSIRLFRIGVAEDAENNNFRYHADDSLAASSYKYNRYEVFADLSDTAKVFFNTRYVFRQDARPAGGRLCKSTAAHDVSVAAGLNNIPAHRLNATFTYRRLNVDDTTLYNGKGEDNMTGRVEYNFKLWKGFLNSTNYYELGSGLEQKLEYLYVEVAAGQGVFSWVDYNGNGIRESDEFETAFYADKANFIRVINPTAEYVKNYSNSIGQSLNINPAAKWRNKKGLRRFISRFANLTSYSISQKNTSDKFAEFANPFAHNIDNQKLVKYAASIRNALSFNKGNPHFAVDYIVQSNENKTMLVTGFDTRKMNLQSIRIRYNITPKIGLQNNVSLGEKTYNSEFYERKNYCIDNIDEEFQFSLQPTMNHRLTLKYRFCRKENSLGGQRLSANDAGLEYRLSSVTKGAVDVAFNCIYNVYNAATDDAVAYEILEGLLPGMNFTWSVNFRRQLANGLQIDIGYNARKCADTKIVHVANVQIKAFF